MRTSVTEAKVQLTELVRRDEVILIRHGQAAVRLVRVKPGPDAARSQDFLNNKNALPE